MIHRLFSLDPRALGLLRIGTAAVLLVDLASRARDLGAHYSDAGVLPREAMVRFADHPWHWSVHLMSGNETLVAALFVLQALAALFLLVGARTGLATAVSWVLLVSLENRNVLVLNNSDALMRLILFWGMMLPWGKRYSFDADTRDGNQLVCSWATIGFVLQTLFVYLFTALLKTGAEWRTEGTALYYALSLDVHAGFLAPYLLRLPRDLLEVMTLGAFWFEAAIFFVFLSPWRTEQWRAFGVAGILMLHAGIAVSLSVALFPLVCAANVLGLLPSWVLDRIERAFGHNPPAAVPAGEGLALRFPSNLMAYFFTMYILFWNVGTLPGSTTGVGGWTGIGRLLRLDQCWNMYAPVVYRLDGWFVVEGRLADGSSVELLDFLMGGEVRNVVSWAKPEDVAGTFKTNRWQKYLLTLKDLRLRTMACEEGKEPLRYLTRYIFQRWNSLRCAGEQLREIRIYYMAETTTLEPQAEAKPLLLWEHVLEI